MSSVWLSENNSCFRQYIHIVPVPHSLWDIRRWLRARKDLFNLNWAFDANNKRIFHVTAVARLLAKLNILRNNYEWKMYASNLCECVCRSPCKINSHNHLDKYANLFISNMSFKFICRWPRIASLTWIYLFNVCDQMSDRKRKTTSSQSQASEYALIFKSWCQTTCLFINFEYNL